MSLAFRSVVAIIASTSRFQSSALWRVVRANPLRSSLDLSCNALTSKPADDSWSQIYNLNMCGNTFAQSTYLEYAVSKPCSNVRCLTATPSPSPSKSPKRRAYDAVIDPSAVSSAPSNASDIMKIVGGSVAGVAGVALVAAFVVKRRRRASSSSSSGVSTPRLVQVLPSPASESEDQDGEDEKGVKVNDVSRAEAV